MNNKKNNRKGFTIVELVIVIAVIAILATVLVPTFGNIIKDANESKVLQQLKNEFTSYTAKYAKSDDYSDDIVIALTDAENVVTYYQITDGVPSTTKLDNEPTDGKYFDAKTDTLLHKYEGGTDSKCITCGKTQLEGDHSNKK